MNVDLNINIFNIVIISGVFHGILFSFFVLSQKKYATSNVKYLVLVVLFLSLSNLQYWFLDTNLIQVYPVLKYIYVPWHWLVLPMFYLYVQNFIGRKAISKKTTFYLLLPFFIVQFIHVLQVVYKLTIDNNYEIPSHFSRGLFVYIEFFSVIFNVLLMILIYRMIIRHENDKSYNIKWVKSETNWLKKLIYLGLFICLCWFIAICIVVIYNLDKSYFFYPMWIAMSALVYCIGYVGLQKSKELQQRIILRKKKIETIKHSNNTNTNSKAFNNLNTYLINNNEYLNPNIKLGYLSEKLNLSEGYISQIINQNYSGNFNDYINTLRIEDAKKMLADSTFNNYTITAIGLECGFNSKTSFYSAFKKATGKTPSVYKKEVQNL